MNLATVNPLGALPVDLLGGLGSRPIPNVDPKDLAKAKDAAQDFEAFFVSRAFEDMFAGLETDPMFGGGEAEGVFRSFLLQEYGKTVAKAGGIGIADMVQRQLLQLQEVSR